MFGFLVCVSFVRRLCARFCGRFCFLVGNICSCSVCAVLLHLFSVARVPLAALFFLFFSSLFLGGRPGRGLLFLLRFLPCALRSRNLRRCRHVLACCALPPFPLFSFPPVFPPSLSSRPASPLSRCLSVCLSLFSLLSSLFFSSLFFCLSVSLSLSFTSACKSFIVCVR